MVKVTNADGEDVMLFEFDNDFIEVQEELIDDVKLVITIYCEMNKELINGDIFTRDKLLEVKELQNILDAGHSPIAISKSITHRYKDDSIVRTTYEMKDLHKWLSTCQYVAGDYNCEFNLCL